MSLSPRRLSFSIQQSQPRVATMISTLRLAKCWLHWTLRLRAKMKIKLPLHLVQSKMAASICCLFLASIGTSIPRICNIAQIKMMAGAKE